MNRFLQLSLLVLSWAVALTANAQEVDFAHDIFPLLKEKCATCHSNGTYEGDLSLETLADAVDFEAIVPGDIQSSELINRITSDDEDLRMPPTGNPLSDEQIAVVKKWIEQGAQWPAEISLKRKTFERALTIGEITLPDNQETHPIDKLVSAYFSTNNIAAPARISDQAFIRRAKLDLLGLVPETAEVQQFEKDTSADRDAKLIKRLLDQNRDYADHWMTFWNDLLRNDYAGTGYIDGGRRQITQWLHDSLENNMPFDQFATELLAPANDQTNGFIKGIKWRGRVNASQVEPLQYSQNITQVFLGVNMKCASCHDSFIDQWKLEDAYGLAAVHSDKPLEIHRCDVPTGKFAKPKFAFESLGEIDESLDRKQRLQRVAELMVSPENGRFARTIVNRIWDRMIGQGIVQPVDIMANEGWSEPLLDWLARDLVEHKFDLKRTMTVIATSGIYRRRAVSLDQSSGRDFVFRGVVPKKMTAEQFVDAVWALTDAGPKKIAAKLPESKARYSRIRASLMNADPLMRALGRPNREQVVTTRPAELSTLQALDLSNGQILASWLSKGAQKWQKLQRENKLSNEQLIGQIFESALTRQPSEQELGLLGNKQELSTEDLEDLLWIVVMLPEFQFVK